MQTPCQHFLGGLVILSVDAAGGTGSAVSGGTLSWGAPMPDLSRNDALIERARRVVPGAMWGHQNAAHLPRGYPQYFSRGEGCMIWDVDGHAYVDLMCAWGPVILGHRHPEVEAAAQAQAARGDCLNGPGEVMVELAELFVDTIAAADWVQFKKNGNDATTSAVVVARAETRRRKILVADGAYHGSAPWCSPSVLGVTAEDRAHILTYDYNDIESLRRAAEAARGDLAGVIVSAFRHDLGIDQELPSLAFAQAARGVCDEAEAALILDDVRAGFRLHAAGSWEPYGVRPDLSSWSKAISNGYALAALTGNDRFRSAACDVFSTGSFWTTSVAMAASLATIRTLLRDDGIAHMARMGTRLRAGLDGLSRHYDVPIRQTGPVQMPTLLFADDAGCRKGFAFCSAAVAAGAYFHPTHNMFLSVAHQESDIDRALEAAEQGLRAVRSIQALAAE
jgi:glutamate-1-semialdehyde 2,1-aminomutase